MNNLSLIEIPINENDTEVQTNIEKEIKIKVEEMLTIPKRLKIGIGIPSGKTIDTNFVRVLFERVNEWSQKYIITMMLDATIPLDLSRNNIVNMAKKENCDYLFFIDSDIIIGEGQLDRLLSHNKDIISGVYYKRSSPYEPLPRKRVAENLYCAIELEGDNLIEVDGIGTGCFLVKMDIFDRIDYPWFEFKYYQKNGEWGQVSEDISFCQKLENIGVKIYCDPIVQCPHIGGSIDQRMSKIFKEFRTYHMTERDKTVVELSEFTGMSKEDIYEKWRIATKLVAKEYLEYISQNSNNPKDFYKTNKNYIFGLTNWHMGERRGFDFDSIKNIKRDYPLKSTKILDFGSGCGQNSVELAEAGYDVSMTDYDCYTSQFARFRAKKRGLNIKFYDIELSINDKFDVILAFDMLEYVPDNEFERVIYLLKSLKQDGGKVLTTKNFGTQGGLYPMCYDESPEKNVLIEKLNTDQ